MQCKLAAAAFLANCVRTQWLSVHAYLLLAQEAEQLRAKVTLHMQILLHKEKTTCTTTHNAAHSCCSMACWTCALSEIYLSALPKDDNALSLQAGVSAKFSEEQPQDKVIDLR